MALDVIELLYFSFLVTCNLATCDSSIPLLATRDLLDRKQNPLLIAAVVSLSG